MTSDESNKENNSSKASKANSRKRSSSKTKKKTASKKGCCSDSILSILVFDFDNFTPDDFIGSAEVSCWLRCRPYIISTRFF